MNYDYLRLSYPVLILGALSITFLLTPVLLYFIKDPREKKREKEMDQETYNAIQLKRTNSRKERLVFKYEEMTKNPDLNEQGRTLEKILGLAIELFSKDDGFKNNEELICVAARSWLERPLYYIRGLEGLTPYAIFEKGEGETLIKWLKMMNWEEGENSRAKNRNPIEMKLMSQINNMN